MARTIVVVLEEGELVALMAEIRAWLDHHRYEPKSFVYERSVAHKPTFRVEFEHDEEALAFAAAFGASTRKRAGRPRRVDK